MVEKRKRKSNDLGTADLMDNLKQHLTEAVKNAMRAKDKDRLSTLRFIMAGIKQREVDERIELDDAQIIALLDKMTKQRRESISQFEIAGRDDLVAKERAELVLIQEFLPQPLSEEALDDLIQSTINELGATGMKDMGKIMASLKPQISGRADGALVSKKVKQSLSSL